MSTLGLCCIVKSTWTQESSIEWKAWRAPNYEARKDLVRWEQDMKKSIETKTFKDRGQSDYNQYLEEEEKYLIK